MQLTWQSCCFSNTIFAIKIAKIRTYCLDSRIAALFISKKVITGINNYFDKMATLAMQFLQSK